jgi:hypothetical protein
MISDPSSYHLSRHRRPLGIRAPSVGWGSKCEHSSSSLRSQAMQPPPSARVFRAWPRRSRSKRRRTYGTTDDNRASRLQVARNFGPGIKRCRRALRVRPRSRCHIRAVQSSRSGAPQPASAIALAIGGSCDHLRYCVVVLRPGRRLDGSCKAAAAVQAAAMSSGPNTHGPA